MAKCPSCGGGFHVDTIRGTTVALCEKCDGLWLTAGDLDRVTGMSLEAELDEWMAEPTECRYCRTALGFGPECVRCGRSPTIQCPQGHGTMSATLVDIAGRELELDRCESCRGIWIDGHEEEHLHSVPEPERPVFQPAPHVSGRGARQARTADLIENLQTRPIFGQPSSFRGIAFPTGEGSEKFVVVLYAIIALALFGAFYYFVLPLMRGF